MSESTPTRPAIQIAEDHLSIDGHVFRQQVPSAEFHALLGDPDRICSAGPPPAYGHRNNQIHLYDSRGLYFNEHHSTRLVQEFVIVFDPRSATFPIGCGWAGAIRLGEEEVTARTDLDSIPSMRALLPGIRRRRGPLYVSVGGDQHPSEVRVSFRQGNAEADEDSEAGQ